ncbi:MAG: glycosyltransferase [Cyclobacteriaceae bacterium]|nr:glycosyltransferase [Cyclobacteriaceae bacterium]
MILVDAIYTNQSGSKRLLEYFVRYLAEKKLLDNYYFLLDQRIESEILTIIKDDNRRYLPPGESSRRAYYRLLPANTTTIFCFGSVPPPIKISGPRVVILQHNPFFFENPGYSLYHKVLYLIKRLYIKTRCTPTYSWIVQTNRIKELLIHFLGINPASISVLPFFELSFFDEHAPLPTTFPLKFIYPADGVPQKNHRLLFRVWERLATEHHLRPELHITLPQRYTHHMKTIEQMKTMGLSIFNHGFVSKNEIKSLYHRSHFLVFPSMSESFGLPLAEAASTGLNVIGSDLPYLYQVVQPSAVFDPKSEDSLLQLIFDLHAGKKVQPTRVLLKDHIEEVIKMLQQR